MRNLPIAALFATTALIPAAYAQDNSVNVAQIDDAAICQELITYVDENDTDATGMTGERADTIAAGEDPAICRDAMRLAIGESLDEETMASLDVEATADIQVAVPEPEVQVQQPAPQVSVEQPQPDVNVTPGRPIVTVNQAEPVVQVTTTPPKVTIDMPKPEILVEIPDPTVDVAMARPRVSVTQPEPTVNVQQGEVQLEIGEKEIDQQQGEARVNVEQSNATVRVNEADAPNINVAEVQPEVRYNAAQPRVEVSESGEPDIQFNQSGEANVRFQRMSAEETRAAAAEQGQAAERETAAARTEADATERNQAAENRTEAERESDQTMAATRETEQNRAQSTGANNAASRTTTISVADLMDRELIGENGDTIGDVENIVMRGDETYFVVGSGGLLGLGEKQVAFPVSEVYFLNDELYTPATTEDAVDDMEDYDPAGYRPLGTDQGVDIVLR